MPYLYVSVALRRRVREIKDEQGKGSVKVRRPKENEVSMCIKESETRPSRPRVAAGERKSYDMGKGANESEGISKRVSEDMKNRINRNSATCTTRAMRLAGRRFAQPTGVSVIRAEPKGRTGSERQIEGRDGRIRER